MKQRPETNPRSGSALLLMAMTLCMPACTMVGPDYVRPEAQVQEKWLESDDPRINTEPADFKNWWQVFKDPVLDALISKAYEQNLSVHQAAVLILESRAVRGIAVGQQYPQVQQLSGGYDRVQVSRNAPNSAFADHAYGDYGISFDAAWEADIWGRFGRGIEAATAELQVSIAEYDDLVVSIAAEVAASYVLIRTFERRLEIARDNIRIQEQSLQIAEARFDAGAVSELDVAQASALLNETRSLIPSLQIDIRQFQNGLSVLLGMPPSALRTELGATSAIPTPPKEISVGVPADLLRRRPDIRRAERLAAAQCARIGIAESDLYPAFSLLGSLGLQTGDSGSSSTLGNDITDLVEGNAFTSLFGLGFSWPILNYGRLKNNVRAQDARFQQLILNYQNTVLRAAQEVEDAMVAFLRSQEQERFLAQSVIASQRSVKLANIQYLEGAADFQRVLDTQRFLTAGQEFHTGVQGAVVLNLVALYKALGGGWEVRRVREFIPESIQEEMRQRTNWDGWLPADAPGATETETEKASRTTGENDSGKK